MHDAFNRQATSQSQAGWSIRPRFVMRISYFCGSLLSFPMAPHTPTPYYNSPKTELNCTWSTQSTIYNLGTRGLNVGCVIWIWLSKRLLQRQLPAVHGAELGIQRLDNITLHKELQHWLALVSFYCITGWHSGSTRLQKPLSVEIVTPAGEVVV